ncbi:hypothetical protein Thermo_02043 [Thermoplasmatales archaeon]|nr:hypothetical protein Thermo_02043 [Thermoplasmatales archaeon]
MSSLLFSGFNVCITLKRACLTASTEDFTYEFRLHQRRYDSIIIEVHIAIDILRKSSLVEPVMQSDNGSSFIANEFKIVLWENHLTKKINKVTHTIAEWDR